jgi:hypothetical protein
MTHKYGDEVKPFLAGVWQRLQTEAESPSGPSKMKAPGIKPKTTLQRIGALILWFACLGYLALMGWVYWQLIPWSGLLTERFAFGVVLCFLTTWLFARLDHGARLRDVICDVPNLVVGMLFSAVALCVLYRILKFVFE